MAKLSSMDSPAGVFLCFDIKPLVGGWEYQSMLGVGFVLLSRCATALFLGSKHQSDLCED
jgi:hypothetical protein